jgi:hypothetical protein
MCVCVSKAAITTGYFHTTRQRVQSPTIERAASKLAMPMTRKNEGLVVSLQRLSASFNISEVN